MDFSIDCLKSVESGVELSEEQLNTVGMLISYVENILNTWKKEESCEYDYEYLYTYCRLALLGFINKDIDTINYLLDVISYNILENDYDAYGLAIDYPLAFDRIKYIEDDLSPFSLYEIAALYREGDAVEQNDEKYFYYLEKSVYPNFQGLVGGFDLVNTLLSCDGYLLELGGCYREGIGCEKDLVNAFNCYIKYHRDHLCQKHGYHNEEEYEEGITSLYDALYKDYNEGKNYKGLFYCLAVMYKEGIGTSYNPSMVDKLLDKEIENACGDKEYISYIENYRNNLINCDFNFKPIQVYQYKDLDKVKKGDYIELFKYNYRSVIWKVLDIKDDKLLLHSTTVLESSYIAKARANFNGDCDSYIEGYLDKMVDYMYNEDFDPLDIIECNEDGKTMFVLSKEDIIKYYRLKKDRLCRCRFQAKINGYDSYGVDVLEDDSSIDGSASYWTSTKENDFIYYYVDCYGDFYTEGYECLNPGIRPAMWIKRS